MSTPYMYDLFFVGLKVAKVQRICNEFAYAAGNKKAPTFQKHRSFLLFN
jgi:hypothetical protein